MIVTEEEAKTKDCRVGGVTLTKHHPASDTYPAESEGHFSSCIGSACMAWRWHRTRHWQNDTQVGEVIEPRQGFCGKAGKP